MDMVPFEWREEKNGMNCLQHGIGFEGTMHAFDAPHALVERDRIEEGEGRWQTIALGRRPCGPADRTHPERKGLIIRLVSARRANRKEGMRYAEDRGKSTY